jgi:hypothetical protein
MAKTDRKATPGAATPLLPRAGKATVEEMLLAAKRKLEKVTARVDDEVEKVAQVAAVIEWIIDDRLAIERSGVAAKPHRPSTAEEQVLRTEARAGATALVIEWNADGSAEVRINGGASFRLQPKPALLLSIIAAPGGRAAGDSLVGWRSYAEVATELGKNEGRVANPHSIDQTIHRLRTALKQAGQNWFFVQTNRRGMVRFALRHDTAGTSAVSAQR